jgi:hypothetical protein
VIFKTSIDSTGDTMNRFQACCRAHAASFLRSARSRWPVRRPWPHGPSARSKSSWASPGGGTDITARSGRVPGQQLGTSVVVVNKPGASGELGLAYVAKAAPEGYVLGMTNMPGGHAADRAPHPVQGQ